MFTNICAGHKKCIIQNNLTILKEIIADFLRFVIDNMQTACNPFLKDTLIIDENIEINFISGLRKGKAKCVVWVKGNLRSDRAFGLGNERVQELILLIKGKLKFQFLLDKNVSKDKRGLANRPQFALGTDLFSHSMVLVFSR